MDKLPANPKNIAKKKVPVTTTIDPDILAWIQEQTTVSQFLEDMAKEFASKGFFPDDIRDMPRKLRFYASKTVELQSDVQVLKKENTALRMKLDVISNKVKVLKDAKEKEKA